MKILSHRGYWNEQINKNSSESFTHSFKKGFGTETDLRDFKGEIVISHDIPEQDNLVSFESFLGDLAALISAALAAAYMIAGSKAQRTLETSTYTTICYFICSMTALPMAIIAGNEIFSFSAKEWWILLGLILGAQLLGHSMFNSALKRVSPAVVSLIVFF